MALFSFKEKLIVMKNDTKNGLQVRKNGASLSKKILQGIRILVGLVLLYFALKDANWSELKVTFQTADIRWLLLALALVLAGTALKIWRWSLLLRNFGLSKNLFSISRAYLVGQAANILLPFRGGEVIRAAMLVRGDVVVQTSQIVGTIVIEKSLDLFALTACTVMVIPYLRVISSSSIIYGLILSSAIILLLVIAFGLILYNYWSGIKQWLSNKPYRWINSFVEKADQFVGSCYWVKNWRKVYPAFIFTILIWVMMWLNNLPVFRSVNLPAAPMLGLFILVLVYIGLIPALTPGNIAPFYFFAQLALVTFNVPKGEALAFAVLLHAVVTLPVLILGGVSLLFQPHNLAKAIN
jgi:uncharacterized protein (TIRG00374 family)